MVLAMRTYGGYGITEMRTLAREYKIAGRSKMSGDELLTALRAYWDAKRQVEERRVLGEVRGPWVGAELVMSCGCVIRATSEPRTSARHGDALYVFAEYVSLCANEMSGWASTEERRVAYLNQQAEQNLCCFMLYQLHANTEIKAA
jgi:hypothetical protein